MDKETNVFNLYNEPAFDINPNNEKGEILVIGAGLPRTGTNSTKVALQILLGGKCYHMKSTLVESDYKQHQAFWTGLNDGSIKASPEMFREFFQHRDFVAGVDFPFSVYFKSLLEAYPNAKVVLTVRDPLKWAESVRTTIAQIQEILMTWSGTCVAKILGMGSWRAMGQGLDVNVLAQLPERFHGMPMKDAMLDNSEAFVSAWEHHVKSNVPSDRLLVFSVKEGWKPLCKFLDLPEPAEEFPNVNDRAEMMDRIGKLRMLTRIFSGTVVALVSAISGVVWWKYS